MNSLLVLRDPKEISVLDDFKDFEVFCLTFRAYLKTLEIGLNAHFASEFSELHQQDYIAASENLIPLIKSIPFLNRRLTSDDKIVLQSKFLPVFSGLLFDYYLAKNIIEKIHPERIFLHKSKKMSFYNGIWEVDNNFYFFELILLELAKKKGISVIYFDRTDSVITSPNQYMNLKSLWINIWTYSKFYKFENGGFKKKIFTDTFVTQSKAFIFRQTIGSFDFITVPQRGSFLGFLSFVLSKSSKKILELIFKLRFKELSSYYKLMLNDNKNQKSTKELNTFKIIIEVLGLHFKSEFLGILSSTGCYLIQRKIFQFWFFACNYSGVICGNNFSAISAAKLNKIKNVQVAHSGIVAPELFPMISDNNLVMAKPQKYYYMSTKFWRGSFKFSPIPKMVDVGSSGKKHRFF